MSPRIHIAYLHPHSELAGGERILLDLCSGLDKSRFQPFVILPREGRLAELLRKSGSQVSIIPFRRDLIAGFPPAFSRPLISKISGQLKNWNVDLLHLSDSYLTVVGGLAARRVGIPVALTAHGPWDAHFFFQDVLNRLFLERIWFPTEYVHEALRRRKILPEKMLIKVPFGVDTKIFSPAAASARGKLGLSEDEFIVLRVARFDAVKDYPTFLRAADELLGRYPQLHFIVLGGNPLKIASESEQNRLAFETYLNERPQMKARFHVMGHQEDVTPFIAAADVVVSSSLSESFGLNLVEAMAMERPVVSTNVGGPSEIVVDGVTGCLVQSSDAHAMAAAVAELIENKNQRIAMGKRGRERVLEMFNLANFVKSMQHEYETTLRRP
jgi:glycosyltransferase involved in cell wall biosynthesis